jgi:hypothetical protein
VAITNSYPLVESDLQQLWQTAGYQEVEATPLASDAGVCCQVQNGSTRRTTLLGELAVLTFENVLQAIQAGVNTVVGSTRLAVFSAKNLDDFFARPNPSNQADELVLISASSKDYKGLLASGGIRFAVDHAFADVEIIAKFGQRHVAPVGAIFQPAGSLNNIGNGFPLAM